MKIEAPVEVITRARLYSLVQKGLVVRRGRGIYVARNHALTAEHVLAQTAKLVPSGVLCMLTALRFHGLTTQSPAEVWIALPEKARKPRLDYPRLRIVRFSGAALTEGIEAHSNAFIPYCSTSHRPRCWRILARRSWWKNLRRWSSLGIATVGSG